MAKPNIIVAVTASVSERRVKIGVVCFAVQTKVIDILNIDLYRDIIITEGYAYRPEKFLRNIILPG